MTDTHHREVGICRYVALRQRCRRAIPTLCRRAHHRGLLEWRTGGRGLRFHGRVRGGGGVFLPILQEIIQNEPACIGSQRIVEFTNEIRPGVLPYRRTESSGNRIGWAADDPDDAGTNTAATAVIAL